MTAPCTLPPNTLVSTQRPFWDDQLTRTRSGRVRRAANTWNILVKGCVHVLPTRASRFWSIFPFAIKHIFPCSFENKCMRLLTHVHGISDFQDKFRVWMAVLGRIQTSDHCIFKSCYCVQSAIVPNYIQLRARLIAMWSVEYYQLALCKWPGCETTTQCVWLPH